MTRSTKEGFPLFEIQRAATNGNMVRVEGKWEDEVEGKNPWGLWPLGFLALELPRDNIHHAMACYLLSFSKECITQGAIIKS